MSSPPVQAPTLQERKQSWPGTFFFFAPRWSGCVWQMWCSKPIGSLVLLYMVTFTINIPPILPYGSYGKDWFGPEREAVRVDFLHFTSCAQVPQVRVEFSHFSLQDLWQCAGVILAVVSIVDIISAGLNSIFIRPHWNCFLDRLRPIQYYTHIISVHLVTLWHITTYHAWRSILYACQAANRSSSSPLDLIIWSSLKVALSRWLWPFNMPIALLAHRCIALASRPEHGVRDTTTCWRREAVILGNCLFI